MNSNEVTYLSNNRYGIINTKREAAEQCQLLKAQRHDTGRKEMSRDEAAITWTARLNSIVTDLHGERYVVEIEMIDM